MKSTDTPLSRRRRSVAQRAKRKDITTEKVKQTDTIKPVSSKKNTFKFFAKLTFWISVLCGLIVVDMLVVRTYPVTKPHNFLKTTNKVPVEIIIKDVSIDLPIIPAAYINGTFQTTTTGVSYLDSSPIPGDKGNSVIYAHNWPNLFGNLPKVKKGDTVTIVFNDKTKKDFTITQTQIISAYQTSVLQPFDDKRITIFTCANFLDADRFVATAVTK